MSYKFEPGKQYRMPTDFGPDLGPRQGPDEKVFECLDNPKSTSISVSSTTNEVELSALLPEGFELAEPVATVTLTHMEEIEWLAGRGYATLGLTFLATFNGQVHTKRVPFLTVLCELPEPRYCNGEAHGTAGWLVDSSLWKFQLQISRKRQ